MTKIFPNRSAPSWAPFNRQQFAALAKLPGIEVVEVLATIPWFPLVQHLGKRSLSASLTEVPYTDTIAGLSVRHPRTLYLPKVGHGLSGGLHALSVLPAVLRYHPKFRKGDRGPDVLLAAWAYPDGCAAILLGKLLSIPVVVKVHGSDINVLSSMAGPRRMMKALLPRADRLVSVSKALAQGAMALGVDKERIEVVRNGVDGTLFAPGDRLAARRVLGLPEGDKILVCISRMERDKGVFDLLAAFRIVIERWMGQGRPSFPRLCLVGGGSALASLQEEATSAGLKDVVVFPGPQPLTQVPSWLVAADVAVMPSHAEGLPNTVLEALACGLPVVATDVGGVSEVLDRPSLGRLCQPKNPPALAGALEEVLLGATQGAYDPLMIASQSRRTWEESANHLAQVLRAAIAPGS